MKKALLMGAILAVGQTAMAQVAYDITLQSSNIKSGKAYLVSLEGPDIIDSTEVTSAGQIHFKSKHSSSVVAGIASSANPNAARYVLILDDKPLKLEQNELEIHVKKASDVNRNLQDILKQISEARYRNIDLIQEYSRLKPEEMTADVKARLKQIHEDNEKEVTAIIRKGLTDNKDNLIPILLLQIGLEEAGTDFTEQFLANYAYKDRPAMQMLQKKIKAEKNMRQGNKMLDVSLPDRDGKERKLSEFVGQGKYVLVDFWASWCGPCRHEMPNVKAAYEKYKDKGFDIVGISLDKDRNAWERAINQMGLSWHHLSDLKGWQSKGAQTYNIRSIPATILFDPEGRIVATNLRGDALEEKLQELLK